MGCVVPLPALASPVAALRDRAEAVVRATLQERTGTLLVEDERLALVAMWLAGAALQGTPEPAAVRQRLWAEDVRDFEFVPLAVTSDAGDPAEALPQVLDDRSVPWERYNCLAVGAARHGGRESIAVVLTRRQATFLSGRGPDEAVVRLASGLHAPVVFATRPDGEVERREAEAFGASWRLDLSAGGPGAWLFEVLAEGPRGPEVLALWPRVVAAPPVGGDHAGRSEGRGDPPDPTDPFPAEGPVAWNPYLETSPEGRPLDSAAWVDGSGPGPDRSPTAEDAKAAEDRMWSLIDAARRSRGLLPLRRDAAITRAARLQAKELSNGPFAHETLSGSVLDRLAAEGLTVARATENIARAAGVAEAHAALMGSPAHRRNLLDDGVSSGGVGVVLRRDAEGRWSAVVSEVFATLLDAGAAADWPAALGHRVNDRRVASGLPALVVRDTLSSLALTAAEQIAASGSPTLSPEGRAGLAEQVRFHFPFARAVGIDLVATAEPGAVARLAHVQEATFTELGIGVVRLAERLGDQAAGGLVIVLLFVER